MHDIKWIREEPQGLVDALARRGTPESEARSLVESLLSLDETRRAGIVKLEELQARRNAVSKEIGAAKKAGDNSLAEVLMAEVGKLKTDIPKLERDVKAAEAELHAKLAAIPNVPLPDVPPGADEHDNVEVPARRYSEPPSYAFPPKQHFEIGEALGQMDFEAAAKLSGARFVVLKNKLARLERAIGQFFLNTHVEEHGLTEVAPPVLVKDEAMFGTAQLPKFEEDQFFTDPRTPDWVEHTMRAIERFAKSTLGRGERTFSRADIDAVIENVAKSASSAFMIEDYWATIDTDAEKPFTAKRLGLIPTAEVPLTNLVANAILSEEELPLRLTALTPCFRAEAGSAGRDTRGMIRQHQFNKVEMVTICTPENSPAEQERMLDCAQNVLKKLDLPHRVVMLCTGDMGFASGKTFDIEVWLPGQNAFREISSVSTCTDFQARRMNARYRSAGAKSPRFLHTLNGSGVAVGRAMVAVLETYQNADGSVTVPDVLVPYMGGLTRIEA
ncbi:serine--tRNA ligase [Ancylobacter sp. A5.8]|uniref:serine--tRNA ligase n=1 Tax=Ancylobacter gelatini TaxID=2919920 RepID=UPI001F4DDEF1|nr:serine--tRNA ligase [Ancylobacter gelatini]MCJ8143171.1 serine--tRNA ligase [Ancylobacter gelatini]